MASIEAFRPRSTLDALETRNMGLDVAQLDVRSSRMGEFVGNGLLDDDGTEEETRGYN